MSKKIVLFGASYVGVIKSRLKFIEALKKNNYQVLISAPSNTYSNIFNFLDVEYVPLELNNAGINIFSDLFATLSLYRTIISNKPDMVFFYNIKPVIYGSIIANIAKVKKIYSTITGLGTVFVGNEIIFKVLRIFVKILFKLSLKFSSIVFFQNQDDLNLFLNEGLVDEGKVVLTNGSGVDLDYYSTNFIPKEAVFLSVSRLIKDKGVNEYISACRILKSRYPNIKFYLVGKLSSNPTSLCGRSLSDLIAGKYIEYINELDDIKNILNRVSIFVLPSYREGMSRASLEALSMGRPIITTDAPGCRETVIHEVNGYLVPVKNVEALVNAMEKFILHPEIIVDMGRESRRLAEEKYDVNKVNKIIFEAIGIDWVVKKPV